MGNPLRRSPRLTRRGFLITAAGSGVAFGFTRAGLAQGAGPSGLFEPTIWYDIDEGGIITVNIIRAEMGQHVGTGIARIVAEELHANWDMVRIRHVDSDPKWGLMITGGSWSIWQSYAPMSQAGAAGRIALINAGAALLGADPQDAVAASGQVTAGGASISFAQIIVRGELTRSFTPEELKAMPIKPVAERRLIGQPVAALDIPEKTDGSSLYGIDAVAPGMVFARPKLPPTRNGSVVVSIDDSEAQTVPGYLRAIALEDPSDTVPGWVMVIAETFTAVERATDLLRVEWTAGETATTSEQDILDRGAELIADPAAGSNVVDDEGLGDAFANAASEFTRTYTTASAMHFALEPVNALAFERDGIFEIHTGNQWQSLILPTLAVALDRPEDSIVMRTYRLGGGFGRRLNGDYAVPAALTAKAIGGPVKMVLTRADDMRFDSFRSPSVQTLRMAFDDEGKVTAMDHAAAAGWPTGVMLPSFMADGLNGVPFDGFAISGADHWYTVGAHRVRALSNDLANRAFRPGWLRSVGPGWTNWAVESFMDEAAHLRGADPVAFRLALLDGAGRNSGTAPDSIGGALRQAAVLKRAAELGGWGRAMPDGHGLGIATTFGQEREMPTWTACLAEVQVDRTTGVVWVAKLTIVSDAGTVVDPGSSTAQVEGAALWGLSLALYEGAHFVSGEIAETNLNTYTPLRMGDVPAMEIAFIDNGQVPCGLGEPATTVIAPAIGNAIFAATGARLRHLPMRPVDVLAALAAL
ncbi:MAG: molybdopterin cofactor-binding domain-containing protein [Paracoccaceae bacterium]